MDQVEKFVSRGGIRIDGMPVEIFPGHVNNTYLFQRWELGIADLDEVSEQANPIIRYETRRGAAA